MSKSLFLSSILLFYMVASNREITNTNHFSFTSAMSTSDGFNNISKNVYMDVLRGRSNMSSSNHFRELLVYSSISYILYEVRMETQSNNPTWIRQIKTKIFNLLYVSSKKEEISIHDRASSSNNMSLPCIKHAFNTSTNIDQSNVLSSPFILYVENQPINLDLWNSQTHSISIFGNQNS